MARLACYDTALGVISPAPPAPLKAPAVPAAAPQVSQQEPAPPVKTTTDFGEYKKPEETPKYVGPKQLTVAVEKAVQLPSGLSRLTLDNGQIWQTTEAADFETHDRVVISRTLLGHYFISRLGQSSTFGVKRIQ